ncbi:MAG: hypothetical protein WC564_04300 [Patescibacteria group bacterium]
MTERELIKKLNNLQNVKPDASWKTSHREILLSQVQNTCGDFHVSVLENFWMVTRNVFASVPQFAWASVAIVLFLTTGIFFGDRLPVGPNNSLYIARVISERAKLGTMSDGEAKSRLTVQYASEHIRDIASTLSEADNNADAASVAKLNDTFKTEMAKVKDNLPAAKISDDTALVTIADSEISTTGLVVYTPGSGDKKDAVATSTPPVVEVKDAKVILDEAEKLFNEKNYSGALDKLDEASKVIKQ